MQRVLSLQMARGFGESSEFVTKRMCFSFIFSIGFLCLLCGFLLGRFATQRSIEFRAEKKRLELAGNGLESTEYLQRLLHEQLEKAPLDPDFETKWELFHLGAEDVHRANEILSNLSFIHRIIEHQSYIAAIVRGSREPDRYVILSASGEAVGIVLELAKILNRIQGEHRWKPRRSLVFCLFSGSSNPCTNLFSTFMQHKIIAYVAIHHQALQGRGPFIVSGSDIVQSMVLESSNTVKNWLSRNKQLLGLNNFPRNVTISSLNLDIPHVVLSFMNSSDANSETVHEKELRKIILAQVLGQTAWKLSECIVMRWNPIYFNKTVSTTVESINNTELSGAKEKMQETLARLLNNVKLLNEKIDAIDNINTIDTRILNDLLMDLDRALLCPDNKFLSKTNRTEFFRLNHEPFNRISMYLDEMKNCYETAIRLLQDR